MQKHYRRSNSLTGGAYIFYVNGEYRGDDELGKLMHDFNCHDAEDMNYALMADRTRYLKENPKGVTDMCKSMEDMRDKAWFEGKVEGKQKEKQKEKQKLCIRWCLTVS